MAKVKLGDVAREYKSTVKDAVDLPNVGLEHLIPGEIELTQWSEDSDNTFTKGFKKGQVLFGRRRAYLKKAAVAPFDGICSGDITVIEAIPEKIMPELLPFVIQNDRLFDYAVEKSAGSLSPRVKWEHLKNYEFELPEIGQQKKLVDLLWAMARTKKAYQKLFDQTEELVKSQFFEMFEGTETAFPECTIIEACVDKDDIKCGPFGTQLKQSEYTQAGVAVWGIPEINAEFKKNPEIFVSPEKAIQLSPFSLLPGDIAMSRKGNVGQCAIYPDSFDPGIIASDVLRIRVDHSRLVPRFMQYQLHHSEHVRNQILQVSNGAVMAGVNVTKLKTIKVYVPPINLQKEFVAIAEQSDKSKIELQQAIDRINEMIKAIMQG